MKKDISAMALHLVAGAAVGYASFRLASPLYSLVLAAAVAYGLKMLSSRIFNEKDAGWWFGNGGLIYVFVWLITWIIFFNP